MFFRDIEKHKIPYLHAEYQGEVAVYSMSTILNINGYKFFFWSNEGRPLERIHVHIKKNDWN